MRDKRIIQSDNYLDKMEQDWWNKNAKVIEEIWAQNLDMQRIIRLPYLSRMKSFFLNDSFHKPIKILEIGCGTGWVCRLVADKDFHVIGTDFSESQISIAKEMAIKYHKEKFCSYELADASTFKMNVDGVVIHALLHHLSKKEIEEFLMQFSLLKSGTKVFIYEPVFFKKQKGRTTLFDKIINKIIYNVKKYAIKRAEHLGTKNLDLISAMNEININAEVNGWYISPKEVPFYENELENYFLPICTLKRKYIVNKSDLDLSQALTLNSINKPNFLFKSILIPLLTKLDRISFKGKFTHYLNPYQHLFVCFEFIKK